MDTHYRNPLDYRRNSLQMGCKAMDTSWRLQNSGRLKATGILSFILVKTLKRV